MYERRRLPSHELTTYEKHLRNILIKKTWRERHKDPAKLAQESPLASPYFVWPWLSEDKNYSPEENLSRALLAAIHEAAESFWQCAPPGNYDAMDAIRKAVLDDNMHDHYHAAHLELRFFQKYLQPRSTEEIYTTYLLTGNKTENALFNATIRKLGDIILTLRETPSEPLLARSNKLVGMEKHLHDLLSWLQAGKAVSLVGPGGVGKSTLAALVADEWGAAVFQYTVRLNFNDRLSAFVYALGRFLHQQGYSNLWKGVIACGGIVQDGNLAAELLYQDLSSFSTELPLLIVDEIDRLRNSDPALDKPQHTELWEFLDTIRSQVPLLCVGQRSVLESDSHLELRGLVQPQIEELLQQNDISPLPSRETIEILYKTTQGNPRLLLLCIALYRSEQENGRNINFSEIIATVSQAPSFGPILNRLWERLNVEQRELLQRLSVYPDKAPQPFWPAEHDERLETTAKQLLKLGLVEEHAHNTIGLLPAVQERIYQEILSPNLRKRYHLDAASILETLAEYTNAAYHLDRGGETIQSIWLWYPVMEREIQKGQAAMAYTIFTNMDCRNLSEYPNERQALTEIQARLHELYGEIQDGLDIIKQEDCDVNSEQQARVWALRGRFENALGLRLDTDNSAIKSYQQSIEITSRLIAQNVTTYSQSGLVYTQEHNLDEADKIAQAAKQEWLMLRGIIDLYKSEWHNAAKSFKESLKIAEKLQDGKSIALSHKELSTVYTRLDQFEDAIHHIKQAKSSYEDVGDRIEAAKIDHVLTAIYFDMGNYQESIKVGKRAIRFFENIKYPYYAACTGATVAEGYFKSGDYEQAKSMANRVLGYEEPSPTPNAYFVLGLVQEAKGDFPQAISSFKSSLEFAELNKDDFMEAYARRAYGKVLCLDNQPSAGQEELCEALKQFTNMGKKREMKETEELLAELQKARDVVWNERHAN